MCVFVSMCVCVCVAYSPTLTVIHSSVAWHPYRESGWERQRLRETVRTLHSDSMLAVCLAQIRSTLMNIHQLAITARMAYIFTKARDRSWSALSHFHKCDVLFLFYFSLCWSSVFMRWGCSVPSVAVFAGIILSCGESTLSMEVRNLVRKWKTLDPGRSWHV